MVAVEGVVMTDVGGVLARPEDVERMTALAEGRPVPDPAETFHMLDIDGVQYRPEDAVRLGLVPADDAEPEVVPADPGTPIDPATVKAADTSEGEADADGDAPDAGGPDGADEAPAARKRQRRSH